MENIYAYRPGEPLASLAYRAAKARRISARLDALLRTKYNFTLDDLNALYEQRLALAEVAAPFDEAAAASEPNARTAWFT